jgi:hypothetical protein
MASGTREIVALGVDPTVEVDIQRVAIVGAGTAVGLPP